MRIYKRSIDLTGKRQGNLTILKPTNKPKGGWVIRCDCGKVYGVTMSSLMGYSRPGIQSCMACRDNVSMGDKLSIRLKDGRTISQIARVSGLDLNLVYIRHRRGWPDWRLAEVPQRRAS
jgi:hypothetical protein